MSINTKMYEVTVSVFKTKRSRDAYIAATNAENPGAAEIA